MTTDPIFGPQFTLIIRPEVAKGCMQWREYRLLMERADDLYVELMDAREQFITAVRERNKHQKVQQHAAHEIDEAKRFGVITDDRARIISAAEQEIESRAPKIEDLNTQIEIQRARFTDLIRELRRNFIPVLTDPELIRIELPKVDDLVRADGILVK